MREKTTCPSCGSHDLKKFYRQTDIPVHSVLNLTSRERALSYTRGDMELTFCNSCGFIFNAAYDPALQEYSSDCEESQGYSPTFNLFSDRMARELVERYELREKTIIEIGCGKGEFLIQLCALGNNRGIGFDPAYVDGRIRHEALDRITFIRDFYDERYADYRADFIVCKMTLEHIGETGRFLESVRRSIGDDTRSILYFQIPDVRRILETVAFEDIYYEHCSYFSSGSLARLFRSKGFEVLDLRNEYGGQYLVIEARAAERSSAGTGAAEEKAGADDLEDLRELIADFGTRFDEKSAAWKSFIRHAYGSGKKVVIWGGGSKGVAFLVTLGISEEIGYAVDINPHRQGTFLAGSGQEIVAPDFLRSYRPDAVIVMNSVYRDEIRKSLDALEIEPELYTLDDKVVNDEPVSGM